MERLTERTADGIVVKEDYGENVLKTIYQCYDANPMPHYANCDESYCAMEKLAEYEDLEEQGKLLKLPCKIGDKIFAIPSEVNYKLNVLNRHEELNRVCEMIVNRIEISEYGYLLSVCDGMVNVLERSFRETWFLTREEADKTLKEMENE